MSDRRRPTPIPTKELWRAQRMDETNRQLERIANALENTEAIRKATAQIDTIAAKIGVSTEKLKQAIEENRPT